MKKIKFISSSGSFEEYMFSVPDLGYVGSEIVVDGMRYYPYPDKLRLEKSESKEIERLVKIIDKLLEVR